jgi:hypothetical protein
MTSLQRLFKKKTKTVELTPIQEKDLISILDESDALKEQELLQPVVPETQVKSVFGGFTKANLTIEDHMINIEKMTKPQIGDYAEGYEIHLDRRRTKENMINEFIQKLKEKN